MPDGGDWLSSLASKVGTVGSFIAKSLIPAYGLYEQWKDPNASAANLLAGTRAATGMAGEAMSAISDKDPSKLLTAPLLAGLHHAGIGSQGDEWDKGLIGEIGTGFSKIGSLETYVALKGTQHISPGRRVISQRRQDRILDQPIIW